jgi:hypothetical protein
LIPSPLQVTQSMGVPRAYIRMLCELEDFLGKTLAGNAPVVQRQLPCQAFIIYAVASRGMLISSMY